MASKLIHHLETAFGQAIASLTGKAFRVRAQEEEPSAVPSGEETIVWQQIFSAVEGPSFWIAAARELWESVGRMTLEAAGLDEITDADCKSTWTEIVNQTMAGMASGLTGDLGREVTAAKGQEIGAPADATWTGFTVTNGIDKNWTFHAAWSAELAALGEPAAEEGRSAASRDNAVSKTFDLLLDVALPVSVSFGRTSLQIREVLKLNTGSIVELDRFVTDPVEVIVNDCVIARGEVVVVDGNYGVRIRQLASRDERLRSGMAEAINCSGARA